ncbi:Pectinacetylesterase/NOTUM [Dillenia turbinata]|uniref:Pectin acetylesterase n=1 Tax=Dillenia turbinata TaxID=194707 RepID=A0AAN8ZIX6_9MAGN
MAGNPRARNSKWWNNLIKKNWAIIAVGFTVIIFLTLIFTPRPSNLNNTPSDSTSDIVDLTLSRIAITRRAFCLDGSAPAYHFKKGFGSGAEKWLLHIEAIESCALRSRTALGSSKYMDRQVIFAGILSSDPSQNPDFYNWNKVKIRYCDGASFSGHPESEVKNGTKLFFRGQLIWEAIMDELLSLGMSNAKQALLTGCSAGGLATLIHCDDFQERFHEDSTVKCLADAGFFINEKDITQDYSMQSFYGDVAQLQVHVLFHGVAKSLNPDCITKLEPAKCLFPEEIVKNIKTPVFLVNPAYDFWQIQHILVPDSSDPHGNWRNCKRSIRRCSPKQLETLQGFRNSLLEKLSEFQQNKKGGMFINSCFAHCQTWVAETWHSKSSPKIQNKTIAESVGDWYFSRKAVKLIDCPYPCDPTCQHNDFS